VAAIAPAAWLLDLQATKPVMRCSAGAPHDGHDLSSSRRNPCRNTSNSSAQPVHRMS